MAVLNLEIVRDRLTLALHSLHALNYVPSTYPYAVRQKILDAINEIDRFEIQAKAGQSVAEVCGMPKPPE